ncbi:hypothetical protein [Amycolatopsis nigrescens]|uniref:hypothetical protein n=1 Tax=Amycolatopsis nigrescens TaxID=381445 RepID=UPI000368ACE2|nr:hypothetical protein [Amycolatopsis nigrescens]
MESTLELSELDSLVDQLDTQINQLSTVDNAETPSLLLCSYGCGPWSWYHCW